MALTRVSGGILKQPIDVGIITATSLNASGIVTAGTVQVGSATTIHTTGIDLGSGNVTSHNINSTGIITATSFVGPVTGNLTGNADTASNLTGSPSITVTNITTSGNVSIAGTLTYEDVTNIDSVGIITAQGDISIADKIVHTGDTNTAIRFPAADTFTVETAGSERLRITSDGSVGTGGLVASSGNLVVNSTIRSQNSSSNTSYIGFTEYTGGTTVGSMFSYMGGDARSSGYLNFSTNNTERLRITSAGSVGIGTTNPGTKLDVRGGNWSNGDIVVGQTGNAGKINFRRGVDGSDAAYLGYDGASNNSQVALAVNSSDGTILFKTNSEERLRITSDGLVGINSTSPATALDIQSTKNGDGLTITKAGTRSAFLGHNGSGNEGLLILREGGTNKIQLYAESGQNSFINTGGSVGIGTEIPTNSHGKGLHIADANAGIRIQNTVDTGWAYVEYADESNTVKYVQGYRDVSGLYGIRPGNSLSSASGITLDSSGNVGINKTPSEWLHVHAKENAGSTSASRTKAHGVLRLSLERDGGSPPYFGWGPSLDFWSDNYDGSTQRPNARITGSISNFSAGNKGGSLKFFTTPTDTATTEDDYVERMTIDPDGLITTSAGPAFMAYRPQSSWNVSAASIFPFTTVEYNRGGHFNTSTHRFTSPVTAIYQFNFSIIYYAQNFTNAWVSLRKNGNRINGGDLHFSVEFSNASRWHNVSYGMCISVTQGDYVEMWNGGQALSYHGVNWSNFSGFLVG